MPDLVVAEDAGRIRSLTLNRPDRRNALSRALIHALLDAFRACEAAEGIEVVVLRGAGAGFCAGVDLREAGALSTREDMEAHAALMAELLLAPWSLSKPVITEVHGFALGAGCGLALACDAVFCTPDALVGYPEAKHGLLPALVAPLLVRQVGRKAAFELLSAGGPVSAQRFGELGLFRVVGEADLADAVARSARALAEHPPGLLRDLKGLLNVIESEPVEEAMAAARRANVASKLRRRAESAASVL